MKADILFRGQGVEAEVRTTTTGNLFTFTLGGRDYQIEAPQGQEYLAEITPEHYEE